MGCVTDLRVIDGDRQRPWPRDHFGRALPRRPVRGLRLDVAESECHQCVFERWRVISLTHGVFVVSTGLREVRAPLAGWEPWLLELIEEGPVIVHLPGCRTGWCHGCDGSTVRALGRPPVAPLQLLPSPGDDT